MSDRLEALLRTALAADLPEREPTHLEVRAVLRAARERPRRRRFLAPAPGRAALAPGWAMAVVVALVVALGTVTAVPGARAALLGAIDRLERFFGGGEPPGVPLPVDDPIGALDALNFLADAAPGSPRVLARAGAERLVAFRGDHAGPGLREPGPAPERVRRRRALGGPPGRRASSRRSSRRRPRAARARRCGASPRTS